LPGEVQTAVARLTGVPATSAHPIGGSVYEVRLDNGDRLIAKRYQDGNEVLAEACSLRWLAEPKAVRIPRVRVHDDRWLLTDFVPPGHATPAAAEVLGRSLAALHDAGAPAFGTPPIGGPEVATIGMTRMLNVECDTWPEFYARYRIEPYLNEAVDQGKFHSSEAQVLTRVIDKIEELAGPAEPPARLHGDLWSGNVHWGSDGRAWLIDPAAHGGHRETDLAMLRLFGCPNLQRIIDAYREHSPLAEGWKSRVHLHQLFPLLVHTVLFGGTYASQAVSAAQAALAQRKA
jgi:fructosamine-3-kinase